MGKLVSGVTTSEAFRDNLKEKDAPVRIDAEPIQLLRQLYKAGADVSYDSPCETVIDKINNVQPTDKCYIKCFIYGVREGDVLFCGGNYSSNVPEFILSGDEEYIEVDKGTNIDDIPPLHGGRSRYNYISLVGFSLIDTSKTKVTIGKKVYSGQEAIDLLGFHIYSGELDYGFLNYFDNLVINENIKMEFYRKED